jgi:hypothetical protein
MFGTIKLIIIGGIVMVLAVGIWYVTNLKADLATSEANNQKLKDAVTTQQEVIDRTYRDVEEIKSINGELRAEADRQRAEVDALSNKLNVNAKGEKRDFGELAAAKPAAIQRLINRGTKNAIRCLEIASGAPLTEEEKNAKLSSEINPECPSLANPGYTPLIK